MIVLTGEIIVYAWAMDEARKLEADEFAASGVRHRASTIARFVARTGNECARSMTE